MELRTKYGPLWPYLVRWPVVTPLALAVLAALLSVASPDSPEPPGERDERLRVVAAAVGAEVDRAVMTGALPGRQRRLWAAATTATLLRESGNVSRAVHAGRRLGDDGRSICLMQINLGNPAGFRPVAPLPARMWRDVRVPLASRRFFWKRLAGLDQASTTRCVRGGVVSLARMRRHCARRVPPSELLVATLSAYMHGSSCEASAEGERRARLTRRLLAHVR